jgi:hypothetical protein
VLLPVQAQLGVGLGVSANADFGLHVRITSTTITQLLKSAFGVSFCNAASLWGQSKLCSKMSTTPL